MDVCAPFEDAPELMDRADKALTKALEKTMERTGIIADMVVV